MAPLRKGTQLNSDSKVKAQILNEQFQSVFTKEDDSHPHLDGPPHPPIPALDISVDGVRKLLNGLKVNKASGPDNIPNRVLRELADELAPSLHLIFAQSLSSSQLPSDWRNANISPIFKKGDRHVASNYRPVSLTSVCCKLLEHIVCKHIRNHLDDHGILNNRQHGFRKKHSTESQLLVTLHDLTSLWDQKLQTDVVILDFSKAFDCVPHNKLLTKLDHYGIRGDVHQWISCFLKERIQQVVVDGTMSDSVEVESGVPQGTVMGPLLFLLFINDLPQQVTSEARLFADDCLLYRAVRTPEDHYALQRDLENLHSWSITWGMSFNANKCYVMALTNKKQPSSFLYSLGGCVLSKVPSTTYLGVTIREDLQWENHISGITAKANRTLGFLRRNLRYCPKQLRELAYFSLVRSRLEYASIVWDPYWAKDITKLEGVQRRAARFVTNDHRRTSSVSDMLENLDWESLQSRRQKGRIRYMNKIVSGRVAVASQEYLEENLTRTRSVNTRKFKLIPTKTNLLKNSYFPRTIVEWNKTPDSTVAELDSTHITHMLD